MDYCQKIQQMQAAKALENPGRCRVVVGSTGVIGKQLPIDRIMAGVSRHWLAKLADGTLEAWKCSCKGHYDHRYILQRKWQWQFEVGGKTVTIGGMCKRFRYDPSEYVHDACIYVTTDLAMITKDALTGSAFCQMSEILTT